MTAHYMDPYIWWDFIDPVPDPSVLVECQDCLGTAILPKARPDRAYWCPWCGNETQPPSPAASKKDRAA